HKHATPDAFLAKRARGFVINLIRRFDRRIFVFPALYASTLCQISPSVDRSGRRAGPDRAEVPVSGFRNEIAVEENGARGDEDFGKGTPFRTASTHSS